MKSRFDCPSASLSLRLLLKRMRAALWIGLGLAMAIHVGLSQLRGTGQKQKTAKPLTTQFVKRQPRLTKPLEMKKRPRPKRRQMQRQMVSIKARISRQRVASTVRAVEAIQSAAKPSVSIGRTVSFGASEQEPRVLAQQILGAKESKQAIDLSLEMLDVESLNIGKYHAMVIQDPNDKRSIKGFLHLAFVPIKGVQEGTARIGRSYASDLSRWRWGIRRLVQAINEFTDIEADIIEDVPLSSDEVFKVPWLYAIFGSYAVSFDEVERINTGKYLIKGGFLYIEAGLRPGTPGYHAACSIFDEALATQGLDPKRIAHLIRLPNSHPVYHCYFDFDGPPTAGDFWNIVYRDRNDVGGFFAKQLNGYLEGYESADGHLYGIVSLKNFHNPWDDWGPGGTSRGQGTYGSMDPTRALQFGVNMIVFALTQEGSITQQVMNTVNW